MDGLSPAFISSAIEAGIEFTSDFNDPEGMAGAGYYHFNIKGKKI